MEISYYIECSEKVHARNKRNGALSCMATTESSVSPKILPEIPDQKIEKSVLILSTRADTNKPLTASFTGKFPNEMKFSSTIFILDF